MNLTMSVGKEKKILVPSDHDNLGQRLVDSGYQDVNECGVDPSEVNNGVQAHNPDYVVSEHTIECPDGYKSTNEIFEGVPGIVSQFGK